jgi:hypothetical protein
MKGFSLHRIRDTIHFCSISWQVMIMPAHMYTAPSNKYSQQKLSKYQSWSVRAAGRACREPERPWAAVGGSPQPRPRRAGRRRVLESVRAAIRRNCRRAGARRRPGPRRPRPGRCDPAVGRHPGIPGVRRCTPPPMPPSRPAAFCGRQLPRRAGPRFRQMRRMGRCGIQAGRAGRAGP